MNHYINKNTYNNKTNIFYCFQCSKIWKIIWSWKIETEKTRKRFSEDRSFKIREKVRCSSRIEEAEARKNLYHLVTKGKKQRHQIWKIWRYNIVCKVLKVKMQYYLLDIMEAISEPKIFKIGDTFSTTFDWLVLFSP